jgi:nucleoside-diphosphate-sugar epimerase
MKIFIAGGSGTLGMPLVRALVQQHHDVTALTRTPAKRRALEALGASAAVADVYDSAELDNVLRRTAPTHVVNLLTALPKAGPTSARDLEATNRLRTEGTRNVQHAAVGAGAKRMIVESFINVYGLGDHGTSPKSEDGPFLPPSPSRSIQDGVDAARNMEQQVLESSRQGAIEGVVLRYGGFYGLESESTRVRIDALRRRKSPVIRNDRGLIPFIHLDDAVSATIAALERGRTGGVYNIVDDCATSVSALTIELARLLHAPSPRQFPLWLVKLTMPYLAAVASTRLVLSNARAKAELGWQPRFPTYHEGLRQIVEQLDEHAAGIRVA